MELKIDEEQIQSFVHEAILQQLDDDARERLISAAIVHLTTPQPGQFRNGKTPLQDAFDRAVGISADKIVREIVQENADYQLKIRKVVGEAFMKMEEEEFTNYLGTALGQALRNR